MMVKKENDFQFTIRDFCIEDYDSLVSLWEKAGLPYKPKGRDRRDNIEKQIRLRNTIFLVAEVDGKIIGSVIGTHDGRKGWINRLAVAPEYQGKGVAKELVTEVEKRLCADGIKIVACLIETWNTKSMGFFKKLGYKEHQGILYFSKRKNNEV